MSTELEKQTLCKELKRLYELYDALCNRQCHTTCAMNETKLIHQLLNITNNNIDILLFQLFL